MAVSKSSTPSELWQATIMTGMSKTLVLRVVVFFGKVHLSENISQNRGWC